MATPTISQDYTLADLPKILKEMADYAEQNIEDYGESSVKDYFEQIVDSGLFHDSCGKIIEYNDNAVKVSIDY